MSSSVYRFGVFSFPAVRRGRHIPEEFVPKPPTPRGPRRPGARPDARKAGGARKPGRAVGKPDGDRGPRKKVETFGDQRRAERARSARPPRPARRQEEAPDGQGRASPRRQERESRPQRPSGQATTRPAPPRRMAEPVERDQPERAFAPVEPQRIAKLLARAGIASRREIERMIEQRRIAIDGVAVETPATILTSLKGLTVDGRPVRAPSGARLFLFHKPAGVLTAATDPAGRPTIYDRLPKGLPRLMPVGRLDLNTEGLLLLTNDGGFKRQLELPSSGVERSYRARVFGEISQEQLEELIHGVEIDGMRYGPIDANLERRTGRNGWVEMKLTEGKNREVRRVLEHLGLQVSRLIRTAYGPFVLGDMAVGAVIEIHPSDLAAYRKTLK